MLDFLLEIGTEEIPAAFMPPAIEAMAGLAERMLAENHIGHGKVRATGTPRRLVLMVDDMEEIQARQSREVMGPSSKAAFAPDGTPTKACEGFARAQGVAVGDLVVRQIPKGEYVFALKEEGGRPVPEILTEILPLFMAAIPFPKSMRWGDETIRFARPIRWLLAILGGKTIPFEYAGLQSGNISRGHRFMAPGSFTVSDIEGYLRRVKTGKVIVDHEQRRKLIIEALAKEAEAQQGSVLEDEGLLRTVTFLVEYPVVLCGRFKEEYLKLPPEVLTTSMKSHQKYFPVVDAEGRLRPLFLTVSNMKADDMDIIRRGNERVLSARLADAQFFYREDLKESLSAKALKLKQVVYQEKLGTSHEKVERFTRVALHLSRRYKLGEPATVERAALLSKADLVSSMVGEFPELQGIMGKYYALGSGETPEVGQAIYEHYLPRFAGDDLPRSSAGMAVSLADKMDTIAGSFGIGQKPTGSEDPYGLRRLTLGIINIIMANRLEIDLPDLVDHALKELKGKIEHPPQEVAADILEFFRGRLESMLVQEGHRPDVVAAVLASGISDLVDAHQRLEALGDFCAREEFEPFAVAFKRVVNIIPAGFAGEVSPELLTDEAEKELHNLFLEKEKGIRKLRTRHRYLEMLVELAALRPAVDAFFDQVMVMVEDESLRRNRLALMSSLAGLFTKVADFTKITT